VQDLVEEKFSPGVSAVGALTALYTFAVSVIFIFAANVCRSTWHCILFQYSLSA
jgi:hypothetical protein